MAQSQQPPQLLILMKFAEEKNRNHIQSYTRTTITLDESSHTLPLALHNGRIVTSIALTLYSDFDLTTAAEIIKQQVDIVLLGTGSILVFPQQEVRYCILNAGIGLELMNTAAAVRTYNILINEDRNVLALLYPATI